MSAERTTTGPGGRTVDVCETCGESLANEEWRETGFEGYLVSDHGRVIGKKGHLLRTFDYGGGYRGACVGGRNRYIHRLVCIAFIGPPPTEAHQAAHWDGTRTNNHPSNLRWATPSENGKDSVRHGTCRALRWKRGGENENNAKLTWDAVDEIRRLHAEGATQQSLAVKFGVSKSAIQFVVSGKAWKKRPEEAA